MSEEESESASSRSPVSIGIVLILLVAYVLSPGLIALIDERITMPSQIDRVVGIALLPLEWLYNNASPVERFYDAYASLLGVGL